MKFIERIDLTDAQLTEAEKQAMEDILVDHHNLFARHRMENGTNTVFTVKLTQKDDKAAKLFTVKT